MCANRLPVVAVAFSSHEVLLLWKDPALLMGSTSFAVLTNVDVRILLRGGNVFVREIAHPPFFEIRMNSALARVRGKVEA